MAVALARLLEVISSLREIFLGSYDARAVARLLCLSLCEALLGWYEVVAVVRLLKFVSGLLRGFARFFEVVAVGRL